MNDLQGPRGPVMSLGRGNDSIRCTIDAKRHRVGWLSANRS